MRSCACFLLLPASTWFACLSFECILQTQAPTARSESRSSTYIQQHRNAPSGICKLVSNTSRQQQRGSPPCGFLRAEKPLSPALIVPLQAAGESQNMPEWHTYGKFKPRVLKPGLSQTHVHKQHGRPQSVCWCLEERLRSPVEPITHPAVIS